MSMYEIDGYLLSPRASLAQGFCGETPDLYRVYPEHLDPGGVRSTWQM
jgi:hypothetical protein